MHLVVFFINFPHLIFILVFVLISADNRVLKWVVQCLEVIESSLTEARSLYNDVDLHVMMHDAYGKGFIKNCNISPDAYIQMALQLAYFRVSNQFLLCYHASRIIAEALLHCLKLIRTS